MPSWVEETGAYGIKSWTHTGARISENKGPFEAQIWNNVVIVAGALWKSFMQNSYGISVGALDGREKPNPSIYNNTIVNSQQSAINLTNDVGNGFVRNNIIAGSGGNPVISVPSVINLVSNRVDTVFQMDFVDASTRDFRLKVTSPARNQGSSIFPATDYDDIARPKGGSADQGAFEVSN